MDNDGTKLIKLEVRKVTQDVLMFVWHKQEVISKKPASEVTLRPEISEFLHNWCLMVWIESSRNDFVWKDFIENHFKRMTKTPYLFANYVAYASYLYTDETTDVCTNFLDILSVVAHFALYCWQNNYNNFLNTCVDLFCAFFDKELYTAFKQQGCWVNFNGYLENKENFIKYKKIIAANKPPFELFKELQSTYLESNTPFTINNVVLKNITSSQVEEDKRAVNFADSVGSIMKEVYEKQFGDILKSFVTVDIQLKDLYLGDHVASGGTAGEEESSSSQKVQEALENISESLETGDICTLKPQESDRSPKSVKVERVKVKQAKALLGEMMTDIEKISELIKFVCQENSVKAPTKVVNTDKKSSTSNP